MCREDQPTTINNTIRVANDKSYLWSAKQFTKLDRIINYTDINVPKYKFKTLIDIY